MKKIWIAVGIIVLIGLLLVINIWNKQDKGAITVETIALEEENIAETVMTPGTLKLNEEQSVYYEPENGEVEEIHVSEGDSVKKGDQLLRYENKQLQLEEKQTDLQLRSAYLELNNLREQHKEIDKQIDKDPDNEILQEEHDQIKLQQQQANIEIEQTDLQKETVKQKITDLVVKSDITGKVVSIDEQASSAINQSEQKPMIRIGSLDNLIVEGTISEYDTLKIKEDQPVTLTSDVLPDKEWKGKVSLVGELPDESSDLGMDDDSTGVQYPIVVSVEDEIDLKPGFQMLIDIETNKEETTTLPISAVIQEEDENFVFIVKDKKAIKTEVKVDKVTADKIEITDGVTSEDKVIKEPSSEIVDGLEVTVK